MDAPGPDRRAVGPARPRGLRALPGSRTPAAARRQTLETDADVAELLDAVGADDGFLVRLEAQPATLVERIVDREPASWSGLDDLVEHTRELAASMPALSGVDLVLSTQGERAEDVAARIRAAKPDWLS